jgi:hypothetical protein
MRRNRVTPPALALALALFASGCSGKTLTCPSDEIACGDTCVLLQSDPQNCGGCGSRCGTGQACLVGACVDCGANGEGCKADVLASCFNGNEVRAFNSSLQVVRAPVRTSKTGPGSFATLASETYVLDTSGGDVELVTSTAAAAVPIASIPGGSYNDLEHLGAYGGLLYVSNASVGSFVAVDPVAKAVVDEVSLVVANDAPNPLGFDFANGKAYVALSAFGGAQPQGLAVVDLSVAPPWATKPSVKRIDLTSYAFSPDVIPGPARVLASLDGTRVYVTMNDLWNALSSPVAGANGKLVVVDTASDAVVGNAVDLGADCPNPSGMALSGNTLWIACGYSLMNADWTAITGTVGGGLLPVNVSGGTPVPGTVVPVANHAVGSVAICGNRGYAGSTDSGALISFDPDPSSTAAPTAKERACSGNTKTGFAEVYDVACAP